MPQSAVLPPTYVGSDTGHFFLSTVSSLGKENIVKESPRGQKELIGGRYTYWQCVQQYPCMNKCL